MSEMRAPQQLKIITWRIVIRNGRISREPLIDRSRELGRGKSIWLFTDRNQEQPRE
jgi:hypothetical protein